MAGKRLGGEISLPPAFDKFTGRLFWPNLAYFPVFLLHIAVATPSLLIDGAIVGETFRGRTCRRRYRGFFVPIYWGEQAVRIRKEVEIGKGPKNSRVGLLGEIEVLFSAPGE
jgi:hypothetical protein